MKVPPLHLPGFPTVGPSGERDNLERLYTLHSALLPKGRLLAMEVDHARECPCYGAPAKPLDLCICEAVDVTLRLVDPRLS